jgi:Zn/Cd-binding protein ZinT
MPISFATTSSEALTHAGGNGKVKYVFVVNLKLLGACYLKVSDLHIPPYKFSDTKPNNKRM